MKRVFEGCVEAREISLTRGKGSAANPLAVTLIKKSKDSPEPESDEMSQADIQKAAAAIANKLFAMDDVTKAHYLSLDEAGQTAFLEKSSADQKTEAETAKKAKDEAEAEKAARESGQSAREAELEKRLKASEDRYADLEKRLDDQAATAEIEKRARSADFDGYPGGEAEVVKKLKAIAGLPDDIRKSVEKDMATTAATAKRATLSFGALSEDEMEKSAPAHAEVEKKAKALAEKEDISIDVAKGRIYADPKNAALLQRALDEERRSQH